LAHALGLRYRLHRKDLPGTPDLVFRKFKRCIFIHGCFWHRHPGCSKASIPKSNIEFWEGKFDANVIRDKNVKAELETLGWEVAIIWECETKKPAALEEKLTHLFPERQADK